MDNLLDLKNLIRFTVWPMARTRIANQRVTRDFASADAESKTSSRNADTDARRCWRKTSSLQPREAIPTTHRGRPWLRAACLKPRAIAVEKTSIQSHSPSLSAFVIPSTNQVCKAHAPATYGLPATTDAKIRPASPFRSSASHVPNDDCIPQ